MASSANPFDVLTGLGAPAAKNGMMFQNPLSVVDRITSNFGPRSSPNVGGGRRGSSNHKGTDLAEAGQAGYAVEAAGAGTVTFAGNKGGYGLTIEVTHPNGYKTQYSHLESLNAKVGDEIAAGTPVGKVGNTGKSSGPHLHFEVKDPNGKKVDPKSVADLATNRSLSVTPSPRPSDDLGALMSFAPTTSPSMPSMPDMSRFGPETVSRGPSMQSSPMGMVSSPVGPTGGFARAEAPTGFSREPSPDRFGPLDGDAISIADCRAHTESRRSAGIQDGTIHTELGHLRMVLLWAEKNKLLDKAPAIERPAKPEPKWDHLTRGEITGLMTAANSPHVKLAINLMIATGARNEAAMQLTWDRVDFERRMIQLRNPFDRSRRKGRATVPMNDRLYEALLAAKDGAQTPFVIEWAGQPVKSIKRGLKAAGAAIGRPDVSPHMLRHSAAVWLAEDGHSFEEIAQYLGHGDSKTTAKVYARFSPTHLRKLSESLNV